MDIATQKNVEFRGHASHEQFVQYYSELSARPEFANRFRSIRNAILRFYRTHGQSDRLLEVLDIGCNAGTHCMVWAEDGHRVHGLDINEPLLDVARRRCAEAGHAIDLRLGSADHLPWPAQSMDVCLAMELLEHVAPWEDCLREFSRVLRYGGVLFVTTTNSLCPRQSEFTLPGYSWYPSALKRRCETLAQTTHPQLANYATYPAVNWFDPFQLGRVLCEMGFKVYDRFELVDTSGRGVLATTAVALIRKVPLLRLLAHMCKEGTLLLAVKQHPDRTVHTA